MKQRCSTARGAMAFIAAALLALLVAAGPSAAAPRAPIPTANNEPPDSNRFSVTPMQGAERVEGQKSATSRLAQTDPALLGRSDPTPVPVLIKLDYDSLATYPGGVDGLAATSPAVTGKELTGTSTRERNYQKHIVQAENDFASSLRQRVPKAQIGRSLQVVYGGVAAVVPANTIDEIVALPGVTAVQRDDVRHLLTDASSEFIKATSVYPELGGAPNAGKGLIFGGLDTGAWPEHPSFADDGHLSAPPPKANGQPRVCNFGDNPLTPATDVFACNNKLIGGDAFLDTHNALNPGEEVYPDTARDSNGHGTHTATTAAGNRVASAPILGVDRGPINGIAPGAHVVIYKVCGIEGCYSSDSAAAVEAAVLDGVDVINFSISGGTNPFTDPVELAFLDAYAAGVFVAASAGNEGPGASTANHLSPWVTTVAASTQRRAFETTLELAATGGATADFEGVTITAGVSTPTPVVMSSAAPYSDPLCGTPAPPGLFTGKIVACERGVVARVDKGFNVRQGGAVGMILYNPVLQDTETDTHWLPTVHLADGTAFVAFMGSHTGVTARFDAGQKVNGQGDVMAAFSSRGPGGHFVKPDVTAPGVHIVAGNSPTPETITEGPPGELFRSMAGTSMSSPHVAGAALLVRAQHPDWAPGQVKSALMTTAITKVVKEDLVTPADPFDMGAGRIDLSKAGRAMLTFDETAERYAALSADPVTAVHLNVPSVNAPVMPGRLVTSRVAKNVTGATQQFSVNVDEPRGTDIKVNPSSFKLRPGQSVTLTIVIESTAPEAQHFGSIELIPRSGPRLHLPVAFVTKQGEVQLSQACTPQRLTRHGRATCTVEASNESFVDTTVDLQTTVDKRLKIAGVDGAMWPGGRTVELQNVRLDGRRAGVPSVAPGEGPAPYLPLDAFGVPATPVGDEEILNATVAPFVYTGLTYDRIGIDSNGYLVVGGGTVEDNNCCNLTQIPDPARPNNVLAPFWTDLDGTGAPGIFAATLTDGTGNAWFVVEWRVNVFGTTSLRVFQVWIGLNGEHDVTFAYNPANLPAAPTGQDFIVGAENVAGEGQQLPVGQVPTGDLVVSSTAAVPGESVVYRVDVRAEDTGEAAVRSEMVAENVPGTTVVTTKINVVKSPRGRWRAT